MRCFIVADGHEIAKCDKPFDRETFRRNKIKFLSSGLQYGRYHKGDGSSRSGKPGQISDELRHALGKFYIHCPLIVPVTGAQTFY